MDVVLLCLSILALAAYVAAPLYRAGHGLPPGAPSGRVDGARTALDDLEIDRASGLMDEATYVRERAALRARAGAND